MLSDSPALRSLLAALLPGLTITSTPSPSGQRVVFFCRFAVSTGDAKAKQRASWGDVVLKVSEGIHPTQIAYLEKEIHILNSLHSPHYPKLHFNETFTINPATGAALPYRLFVTIEERINAQPLSAVSGKLNSEKAVLKFIDSLVDALTPLWSHPQRLVHRDIKPDNILIRNDGSVAIIDLGIVREEGSSGVTATGSPYGPCTALYASPEQARNDKANISFKSDFFSIGVVGYELTAKQNPFGSPHEPFMDILDRVQNHTPPPLEKSSASSKPFSDFIGKLMEKQPYRRHRTINQLKEAVSKLLNP